MMPEPDLYEQAGGYFYVFSGEADQAAQDLREALQTLIDSFGWQRVQHALLSIRDEDDI